MYERGRIARHSAGTIGLRQVRGRGCKPSQLKCTRTRPTLEHAKPPSSKHPRLIRCKFAELYQFELSAPIFCRHGLLTLSSQFLKHPAMPRARSQSLGIQKFGHYFCRPGSSLETVSKDRVFCNRRFELPVFVAAPSLLEVTNGVVRIFKSHRYPHQIVSAAFANHLIHEGELSRVSLAA